jgi:hypothetical protein
LRECELIARGLCSRCAPLKRNAQTPRSVEAIH